MRVVSGIYRGRTLCEFKGNAVRPTSDMVRESLFNILRDKIEGKTFLDLFCGTGAVGIEALSRGASHVCFNDFSKESLQITQKNLDKIGATDYTVNRADGVGFLQSTNKKFDFVFIDPPYDSDLGVRALNVVANVLTENGVAIFESEKAFEGEIEGLQIVDTRKYGRARLTFFSKL